MVDLLDAQPGDRVLEIAAGPGETGFKVLPWIQPGGELISTDGAPEMVPAKGIGDAVDLRAIRPRIHPGVDAR